MVNSRIKRIAAAMLAALFVLGFAACTPKAPKTENNTLLVDENDDPTAVRTGLAVICEIRADEFEPDSVTKRTFISTAAAVTVDPDGKIIAARVDVMEINADIEEEQGAVSDLRTRREKGSDYVMTAQSELGTSWSEQIAALEEFAQGKTADEVSAAVDYFSGIPTDEKLLESCDIDVGSEAKAIATAASDARSLGADDKDSVKLAVTAENVSGDDTVAYRLQYAAVTVDKNGVITSCMTDESEGECTIVNGEYKEFPGTYLTKKSLGIQYGMKTSSPIGKEWYEQIKALEDFAVGKTADELTAAVGSDRVATDADLLAGCTIEINELVKNIVKAVNS